MELKIFRDTLPQGGAGCTVKAELPLETDIRISDDLPPVGKLVKCFVRPVVLQRQLQPGRLTLEGYLRCTVFYQSEAEKDLCQTEQKLPFTRQLELPEEELPVYADPDMMQRALHNLLGNAMHHIGEDGIFVLRALRCPEGVRVEVEDHGPGISAEDLPYIFDRYYRSRSDAGKQGTGLGLSITKAIFQQHGFRFGVHSTLGKGTPFWFIMTDTEEVSS